jgi:hypothetical protein
MLTVGGIVMSEVSRNDLPPQPIEEEDMQTVGHGDKLEDVVERLVKKGEKEAERPASSTDHRQERDDL